MPDSLRKSASLPTVIEHEPGWTLSSCMPTMMQVLQRQKQMPDAPCEQGGAGPGLFLSVEGRRGRGFAGRRGWGWNGSRRAEGRPPS